METERTDQFEQKLRALIDSSWPTMKSDDERSKMADILHDLADEVEAGLPTREAK